MNYKMIKKNYEKGLWSIQMVKVAVKKGVITKEEYKEITSEENTLDVWTHNKTIQKAVESYRITPQQKAYLKTLKRKEA